MSKKCFCGGEKPFSACCSPFIRFVQLPASPEELMRSRYSAYATGAIDYLLETTATTERGSLNPEEIRKWARENSWKSLEIVVAEGAVVEFKAHYRDRQGKLVVHHERSRFILECGRWYYLDGSFY